MQESCQQAELHREEHQAAQPLEFNPLQPLALQNKGMLPFPVVFTGILNPSLWVCLPNMHMAPGTGSCT